MGLERRRLPARSALTLGGTRLTLNESSNTDDDFDCITEACIEETTEGFSQFHTELFGAFSEKLLGRGVTVTSVYPKHRHPNKPSSKERLLTLARGTIARKLKANRRPASQLRW